MARAPSGTRGRLLVPNAFGEGERRAEWNKYAVPFPYIGLPSARRVIEKYIKPREIAAAHLPYRELDSYGWIDATMKSYMRAKENFIETVILEQPGEYINI